MALVAERFMRQFEIGAPDVTHTRYRIDGRSVLGGDAPD